MVEGLGEGRGQEAEYCRWESECEDCLAAIEKAGTINQKIKLLYRSPVRVEDGESHLQKLNKKLEKQTKKMETLANCVTIQFSESMELSKLAWVSRRR
jgi:hypothetical protein